MNKTMQANINKGKFITQSDQEFHSVTNQVGLKPAILSKREAQKGETEQFWSDFHEEV